MIFRMSLAAAVLLPAIVVGQQTPARLPATAPTPLPMTKPADATATPVAAVAESPAATAAPRAVPTADSPSGQPVIHRPPKTLVALPVYDEVTSTRLQIFLDNHNFGPGKIDGRMGEFFRKALIAYKVAHGMYPTGAVDRFLAEVPEPFTTYTIRPEDEKFIGEVSNKPSEQAKLKALLYGSLLEFVAERFHAAEDYIIKLNRGMDLEKLKVGDTVKVPNVQSFEIESLSEGFVPPNPTLATRQIIIDTHERTLEVRDEHNFLLYEFPITPGSTKLPAPKGTWKILGIAKMPWFRHDEGVLNHGVRTKDFFNLPAGPNNPVGILWMGLNKPGIGIHGTNNPETIGRAGSHGCIRMANWDANKIKDLVTVGTVVKIY